MSATEPRGESGVNLVGIESRLSPFTEESWHVRDPGAFDEEIVVQREADPQANPYTPVCVIRMGDDDPDETEAVAHLIANAPADLRALVAEVRRLRAAMTEIAKGEGAYARDPLTHAGNVIDNLTSIARVALSRAGQS